MNPPTAHNIDVICLHAFSRPCRSTDLPIHRAVTLLPDEGDPKIRNLEFGSSSVDVKNPNQSDASRSAHATAKIMAVPVPDAQPQAASSGCKCSCTVS